MTTEWIFICVAESCAGVGVVSESASSGLPRRAGDRGDLPSGAGTLPTPHAVRCAGVAVGLLEGMGACDRMARVGSIVLFFFLI